MQAGDAVYQRLAEAIRAEIEAGRFGADGRLPSEQSLAEQHSVSRGTVRNALAVLRATGLITSRRGTRRVVLRTDRTQSFHELLSFTEWARAHGEQPGAETVHAHIRPATQADIERLHLDKGGEVFDILRRRLLNEKPIMLERTLYPAKVGRLLLALPNDSRSHTAALEAAGIAFQDSEHIIDVVSADPTDARLLGCPVGLGLLRETRRATDPTGAPLVFSEDRFLPGNVSFSVHNSPAVSSLTRNRA